MFVKQIMTPSPVTVQADSSLSELITMMRDKSLTKFPVLDGSRLVGIITQEDVQRFSPSEATALSVFEINYLLSKSRVRDAMTDRLYTCSPDSYIEDAAVTMRYRSISALCVTEGNRLVGIVTRSDLFDAMINMLGGRSSGYRFVLETPDGAGVVGRMGDAVANAGISMSHFACVNNSCGTAELLVKVGLDADPDAVMKAFEDAGFSVKNCSKS